ncbi:hypothetical protein K1T71_005552, partial [Dendrolimus kikuchii]
RPPADEYPRWALKRLDREALREALIVNTWAKGPDGESPDVDEEAENLRSLMTSVCDAAMPRQGPQRPKNLVYWWNAEIARKRKAEKLASWRAAGTPDTGGGVAAPMTQ